MKKTALFFAFIFFVGAIPSVALDNEEQQVKKKIEAQIQRSFAHAKKPSTDCKAPALSQEEAMRFNVLLQTAVANMLDFSEEGFYDYDPTMLAYAVEAYLPTAWMFHKERVLQLQNAQKLLGHPVTAEEFFEMSPEFQAECSPAMGETLATELEQRALEHAVYILFEGTPYATKSPFQEKWTLTYQKNYGQNAPTPTSPVYNKAVKDALNLVVYAVEALAENFQSAQYSVLESLNH